MALRATSWLVKPGLLMRLVSDLRLAVRLLRDPAVPLLVKPLPVLAAIYLVFPIDVVPDVFPILGQLDDLGVALVALRAFLSLCPAAAVAFHREAIARKRPYSRMHGTDYVIDAEFRHE